MNEKIFDTDSAPCGRTGRLLQIPRSGSRRRTPPKDQLKVLVNNPTKSTFTITDIQGTLFRDDTRFAEVSLLEEAVVSPLSREETVIKCRIHLLDPLAVLVMGLDIRSWNPEEFKLNLKTTVRSHGIKKNFKIDNIALDRVLKHVKIR